MEWILWAVVAIIVVLFVAILILVILSIISEETLNATVYYTPKEPCIGEDLNVTISVKPRKEIKVTGIEVRLICKVKTEEKYREPGEARKRIKTTHRTIAEEKVYIQEERTFKKGKEEKIRTKIKVSPRGFSTQEDRFTNMKANTHWNLIVTFEIPKAIDACGSWDIFVKPEQKKEDL